jgi:exopolysaccharide biosynthesis protein
MGINGGFFAATDYNQPPTSGRSIAYNADDVGESVSYEGRTLAKNYNYNGTSTTPVSRKTAVIYKDSANNTKVQHVYATSIWDVLNNFNNVQTIIGGTSFTQSDWSSTAYNGPTQRTVFAWRSDGNAYLIITPDAINIPQLRESIEWIGLSPTDAIVLDGSGSSSMRVQVNNSFNESFYGEDRYVFNMIRLINAY